MTATDQDRDCAALAKAALFPKRMHRDVAHASHFPALLQLDLLRDKYLSLSNASVSSVFPRHVVVVRNLADGGIQWNGEPDFADAANVSFGVVPDQLSVRCTSNCSQYLTGPYGKTQRAFRRKAVEGGEEIVLCSDRILQSDIRDSKYKGVAKDLPPKSLQAVEEVLAHQLVQVRHEQGGKSSSNQTLAQTELEAAQAAECYFSRHVYDERKQIKKGIRLQTGYSWLPSFVQSWSMSKCLSAVAVEHLVAQKSMTKADAQRAVEAAMKAQT